MNNESQLEATPGPKEVPLGRLWFQFAASCIAWFAIGVIDVLILWCACVHEEQFGGPSSHPGALALFFVVWAVLAGVAVAAGTLSYRTWRSLAGATALICAEGRERSEFMSLAGLFISVTLGMGFFWMCLPLFILQMCERAR